MALACGGTVAQLADKEDRPLVVTVFGGEVTDDVLTHFARLKHARWGVDHCLVFEVGCRPAIFRFTDDFREVLRLHAQAVGGSAGGSGGQPC